MKIRTVIIMTALLMTGSISFGEVSRSHSLQQNIADLAKDPNVEVCSGNYSPHTRFVRGYVEIRCSDSNGKNIYSDRYYYNEEEMSQWVLVQRTLRKERFEVEVSSAGEEGEQQLSAVRGAAPLTSNYDSEDPNTENYQKYLR